MASLQPQCTLEKNYRIDEGSCKIAASESTTPPYSAPLLERDHNNDEEVASTPDKRQKV